MSCYTTVRGPDILRNVVVSGYATFYQVKKCFVKIMFSLLTKRHRVPDLARGPYFEDPCNKATCLKSAAIQVHL